jgi:hypothetical protein
MGKSDREIDNVNLQVRGDQSYPAILHGTYVEDEGETVVIINRGEPSFPPVCELPRFQASNAAAQNQSTQQVSVTEVLIF